MNFLNNQTLVSWWCFEVKLVMWSRIFPCTNKLRFLQFLILFSCILPSHPKSGGVRNQLLNSKCKWCKRPIQRTQCPNLLTRFHSSWLKWLKYLSGL